jgi:hypothetical protein
VIGRAADHLRRRDVHQVTGIVDEIVVGDRALGTVDERGGIEDRVRISGGIGRFFSSAHILYAVMCD